MKEEKLLHLLKKKRGFFEAILELSTSESSLSLDEWVTALKQKKVLLSCVEKVDSELHSFKDSLEVLSQEIGDEIEKIKDVIQEILYFDNVNSGARKKALKQHEDAGN